MPRAFDRRMRAWLLLLALTAVAEAKRPAPRMQPPFFRNCREAATWDKIEACRVTNAPSSVVRGLTPTIKMVDVAAEARHYLFAELEGRWRMIYQPGDENYELVDARAIVLGKQPAQRIDLAHHVALGNTGVMMERVTLVCFAGAAQCVAHVTACTVLERGRTVGTFHGEIHYDNGVALDADRRYAGDICASR